MNLKYCSYEDISTFDAVERKCYDSAERGLLDGMFGRAQQMLQSLGKREKIGLFSSLTFHKSVHNIKRISEFNFFRRSAWVVCVFFVISVIRSRLIPNPQFIVNCYNNLMECSC